MKKSFVFLCAFVIVMAGRRVSAAVIDTDLHFRDQNYFMKPDYVARTEYLADSHANCDPDLPQDEVYRAALKIASECSAKVIGDVGCGSAYKLLKYFSNFETIGFEVEPNFEFLKSHYPERKWVYGNFPSPETLPSFDVIIFADVIEHLVDPDQLLNWLRRLDFKYLVISTPDKDMLPRYQKPAIQSQTGPPVNLRHVREWSFVELEKYIGQYFDIQSHYHNQIEWMAQVMVVTKKDKKVAQICEPIKKNEKVAKVVVARKKKKK